MASFLASQRQQRNGQMGGLSSLVPVAVAIISLAIVVGFGVVILAELEGQEVTLDQFSYSDEAHQPTATNGINQSEGFQQYTLDVTGGDLDSVTVVYQNSTATNPSNTTLTEGSTSDALATNFYNYTVDYGAHQVNISKVDTYDSSAGSKFFNDYTNNNETEANTVLNSGISSLDTFSQFFVVIIIVAIAAVLFILLGGMRRTARRSSV